MPQSLVKNYLHIVFSTKDRVPLITDAIESELYAYIGGLSRKLECPVVRVGGYRNHVHILCNLSRKMALMDYLEMIKKRSSKWIKTKGAEYSRFYWQRGYGAFSVDCRDLTGIIRYIENQHEHHARRTFKREFLSLLDQSGMEYDERYLWD